MAQTEETEHLLVDYTPKILDRSRNGALTVNDSSSTLPLRRKSFTPLRAQSTAQLTQTYDARGEDLARHLRLKYKRKLAKRGRHFDLLLRDLASLRLESTSLDFFRRKHPALAEAYGEVVHALNLSKYELFFELASKVITCLRPRRLSTLSVL